ncbi:MAG TPA: hypothetical protein VEF76_05570, partial [Patescibacteria group bacterium]|nr:hypothetical protein [Patescibacteria group bacterium]
LSGVMPSTAMTRENSGCVVMLNRPLKQQYTPFALKTKGFPYHLVFRPGRPYKKAGLTPRFSA